MVMSEMRAIAMGVHVLDVLVRPVEEIPRARAVSWSSRSRSPPAGSAGGTAVTLAKLGAHVRSAGAIGTDAVGDMLVSQLERFGIDTSLLVRRDEAQTSASVLPIRPDGSRPSFHVIGANATYGPEDVDWDAVRDATYLHLGGPEFMGGEAAARDPLQRPRAGPRHLGRHPCSRRAGGSIVDWISAAFSHRLPASQRRPGARAHRHR